MKKQTLTTYRQEITDYCQTLRVLIENYEAITLKELRDLVIGLPAQVIIQECLSREDIDWLLRMTWSKFSTLKDTKEWNMLFDELVDIQNNGKNDHRDLLTITEFMGSIEELEAHVKANRS